MEEPKKKRSKIGEHRATSLTDLTDEIWHAGVLPCLPSHGRGHYLHLALVCRDVKEMYRRFCQGEVMPTAATREEAFCTHYSVAFANKKCATFFYDFEGQQHVLEHPEVCRNVAKGGNLEVLKHIGSNFKASSFPLDETTCAAAAEGGQLETLHWLHSNDCPWDHKTCANAAKGGHLDVLKYAIDHGCPWDDMLVYHYAAANGHLEIMKFLKFDLGVDWAVAADCPSPHAAKGGHLEILKWMDANSDIPLMYYFVGEKAAGSGHLEILKWLEELHEFTSDRDESLFGSYSRIVCAAAAAGGHLEVLKWGHEVGMWWDSSAVCKFAARGGGTSRH